MNKFFQNRVARLLFLTTVGLVGLVFLSTADKVSAQGVERLNGWAYSQYAGWISFSSGNDHDATTVGVQTSPIPYAVTVETQGNTKYLNGYAWNSNIGWIKFGINNGCPSVSSLPCRSEFANGEASDTKENVGWARACAGAANQSNCSGGANPSAGGWDGWISLSRKNQGLTRLPESAGGWGVFEDLSTRVISGYAYGSDVVGWVFFNLVTHEGGGTFGLNINNQTVNPGITQPLPIAVEWTNAADTRRVDLAVTTNPLPAGVTLSFTGNRDRCSSYSGTTCSTEASLVVAGNAPSGTYSITIKGDTSSPPALTASKSFNLTINDLPASVQLQVNGSDGPVRVIRGQRVKLTWTTENVDACVGTNFNTGGALDNLTTGVLSAPVLSATTYTLTCTRASVPISDNVDSVAVSLKTPGGGEF